MPSLYYFPQIHNSGGIQYLVLTFETCAASKILPIYSAVPFWRRLHVFSLLHLVLYYLLPTILSGGIVQVAGRKSSKLKETHALQTYTSLPMLDFNLLRPDIILEFSNFAVFSWTKFEN